MSISVELRRVIAFFVLTCWLAADTHAQESLQELWVTDSNGCKVMMGYGEPPTGLSIRWSGNCRDGLADGLGVQQVFEDGRIAAALETSMLEGRANGYSKLNDLTRKFTYEGDYLNGTFHGYGRERNIETGVSFEGEYWRGSKHGWGVYTQPDGTRTEGRLKDDEWEGLVSESKPNGTRWIGVTVNGRMSGPLIVMHADGGKTETVAEGGSPIVDATCRETFSSGESYVGRIRLGDNGMKQCRKTFRSQLKEFLGEMTQVAASTAIATYAAENNLPLPPGADPFGVMAQVYQIQTNRIRQLQAQQQQEQAQKAAVFLAQQTILAQNARATALAATANSQNSEIAALQRQIAELQGQRMPAPTAPPPQRQTPSNTPAPGSSPLRAHYVHSDGYEMADSGGWSYIVYVENDGDVALSCDTRVKGIVWSATGGNNLQNSYSDRRTSVVYPGRKDKVGGFGRAVENSGSYEVACKPLN